MPACYSTVTKIEARVVGFLAGEVWQMKNRALEASLAECSSMPRLAVGAAHGA